MVPIGALFMRVSAYMLKVILYYCRPAKKEKQWGNSFFDNTFILVYDQKVSITMVPF
jgi:hypothetical protein